MSIVNKILIIEDDPHILMGLVDMLNGEGYAVVSATNGVEALEKYKKEHPDIVLLDIMMPKKSGYDVCKEIRHSDQGTIIIMLTAKGQEVDKVIGLEAGADDYIVKPFGVSELLARIRAVARRKFPNSGAQKGFQAVKFGNIEIDPKTLTGKNGKKSFAVNLKELELLKLFLDHDGEVLSRDLLLEKIWGVKYLGTTRTLDQHIALLRKKIEDDPARPQFIQTVHGVGYRFVS